MIPLLLFLLLLLAVNGEVDGVFPRPRARQFFHGLLLRPTVLIEFSL